MHPAIRYTYNIIRTIIVTTLVTVVVLYASLYVLLCIPAVQQRIKSVGEEELSKLLKTKVTIGELSIKPFNQLILYDVNVPDQQNHDLVKIDVIGAGINIEKLISDGRIEINYAELLGLHGHITKADKNSPTNLQFIIDAFKPKGDKPPKKFDLAIHNIVIRNTDVTYDVLSEPKKQSGFDANHIGVQNLCADIDLPRLKNDDFLIDVKRLAFAEKSGFEVKQITTHLAITAHSTTVADLKIELPHSEIALNQQVLTYDSLKHIGRAIKNAPLNVHLKDAKVTLADLASFVPAFQHFDTPLYLTCSVDGNLDRINVSRFYLRDHTEGLNLQFNGVLANVKHKENISFNIPQLKLQIKGNTTQKITSHLVKLKPNVNAIINNIGDLNLDAAVQGNRNFIDFKGKIRSAVGDLALNAVAKKLPSGFDVAADVKTPQFNLGHLLSKSELIGSLSADATVKARVEGKKIAQAVVKGDVAYIDFRGYRFHNIVADVTGGLNHYKGAVSVTDPNGVIDASGDVVLNGAKSKFDIGVMARNVNLGNMKLYYGNPKEFSFDLKASLEGNSLDNINGFAMLDNISFVHSNGKHYEFESLTLNADNASVPQVVRFDSEMLTGELSGKFDFKTLVPAFKALVSQVLPNLMDPSQVQPLQQSNNDFRFNIAVQPNEKLQDLLKLPVKLLHKATIDGNVNMNDKDIWVNVNIPYLQQGKKLIEGSAVSAYYDTATNAFVANVHTLFPSKNGKIAIGLNATAANGRIDTDLGWKFNRERDFHGNVLASVLLSKNDDKSLAVHTDINPSQIVVNDTVWQVNQGAFDISKGVITIYGIHANREGQFIDIEGVASKNPDDAIKLELKDINLDFIFETLQISNVDFGGIATGVFYAKDVFSKEPKLLTPNLHVDNLCYNKANMGDADIESHWDNEEKGVAINAELSQKNGRKSYINGAIFPMADSLYLEFKVDRANVKFMKPFMSAFTSDIDGMASGYAVLFGNFKDIDLFGDIYAEDLKLKLDFSNVYYHCTDSIHMRPGLIQFSNVKIKDRDGHSGNLNGWVKHEQFHNASFNFTVTGAKDLLCYDTNASNNPVWYGTIYGNGSAFVDGEPGFVNIKVNMESAPRSKFTFVMSDDQVANDYKFITYRDRDVLNAPQDTVDEADTIPDIVKLFTQKIKQETESDPTKYLIDLQGDITPDLQMYLVMDPIGGDKIKATGRGNLQMKYDNTDEKLEMYGKYTLEKGTYNFTLQDIIVKDFTIKNGSTISFQGDPYNATLDIQAIYSLNANIRDLDQSFADDRELNRTSVPVHALLKASGVISQPDIAFDLEFPTLTSEAYRKIKSIISTDDMMNRQIIYLLALNRFYTPEYMNGVNTGNEWTSIASSTISSQLSSLLGRINENWTIAPNFRSNKGDFTDTEFDLALSSQLLNNRLRFNGNFGYRDNTYNTKNSNFIGDFDVEYLLNSKGTWLLKAYNHFNDQNLYTRNAMTTQGVGIVFKHDFDRLFNFLHKKKTAEPKDSTSAAPAAKNDSIKAE
ncbi:MAG: translocation/assembly module TamB domain-containing protein [Bacteroidales bacterium]|nr:translocation/assembly module TamB domain-containing protein [Bacteroidales bacterium]